MSDLRGRCKPIDVERGTSRKLIGAAIIAAVLCSLGAYAYHTGAFTQPTKVAQAVPDTDLPS